MRIRASLALLLKSLLVFGLFLLPNNFPFSPAVFADISVPIPFSDIPQNPLYYPAIEIFQKQNIITGDTLNGEPAAIIRLLEEKQELGKFDDYLNLDLNDFTFKIDALLKVYYSSVPGAPHFCENPKTNYQLIYETLDNRIIPLLIKLRSPEELRQFVVNYYPERISVSTEAIKFLNLSL